MVNSIEGRPNKMYSDKGNLAFQILRVGAGRCVGHGTVVALGQFKWIPRRLKLMCAMTSLAKRFMMSEDARATGCSSLRHIILLFFGTHIIVVVLK